MNNATERITRRGHLQSAVALAAAGVLGALSAGHAGAQSSITEVAQDLGDGTAQNWLLHPDGRQVPVGCRYALATGECVGPGATEAIPAPADPVRARLTGKVSILSTDARRGLGKRGPQIAAFGELFPNLAIDIFWPVGREGPILQALLAANEPLDVFSTGDVEIPTQLARSWLRDLRPLIDRDQVDLSDWYQALLDIGQWEGKVAGLAESWDTPIMYYNRNLFERNGLKAPDANWTYDHVLDAARRIARTSDDPAIWGAWLNQNFFVAVMMVVWGFGGDYFSADRKRSLLNTPESVAGLQWIADLIHRHRLMPPPAYTSVDGQRGGQLFRLGRLGLYVFEAQFRDDALDFFAVPIPKGPAGRHNFIFTEYHALGAASARNPEGGWEWIKYITGPEGYETQGTIPVDIPARKSIAEGPRLRVPPWMGERGVTAARRATFPSLRATNIVIGWDDAMGLIGPALTPVWAGEKDAKSAMAEVVPAVNALLARG